LGDVVVALERQKDYPTAQRLAMEFSEGFWERLAYRG
jgi:hypothetical protein